MENLESVNVPDQITYEWLSNEYNRRILGDNDPKFILATEDAADKIKSWLRGIMEEGKNSRVMFCGAEIISLPKTTGNQVFFLTELFPSFCHDATHDLMKTLQRFGWGPEKTCK